MIIYHLTDNHFFHFMHKRIIFILVLACVLSAPGCGDKKKGDKPQPLDTSELAEKVKPAGLSPEKHPGREVYATYCATCHQSNGSGVPGMYPPLTSNRYIENKDTLIAVVLNGMKGKIEVDGEIYNNYMAPHSHLSDQELADVTSYVRAAFGNDLDPVTAGEVASARKK